GLAYLFISHDLGVVEHIAHRVAVMYLGRIVELADRAALFASPQHPYTEALLAAAPLADPRGRGDRPIIEGEVPSPINPPSGCAFHPRCPYAIARCRTEAPALRALEDGRLAACHLRQ
ncbi:MAG: oligopeptide/dipeptide ABC transporter ATP-binding protein, partial [Acetobacteraceae bacterium]